MLLPNKFLRDPSGLGSVLEATTEAPPAPGFRAKYGLKPPSLLDRVFQERVVAPLVVREQTTRS